MKRRVTYRPSKAQATFSGIFGGIFVLIGLFVVIPIFGPFGVLWTLFALAGTGMSLYQAYGKNYAGPEIHIEEDEGGQSATSPETHDHIPSMEPDPKRRLEQLESLKDAGLVTDQEYKEKRREILKGL